MSSAGKPPHGDAQTRELLIQAALRLFARHGLEAVSLRQVIAEAQQSNQSAVQYYFGGKDGLITAVLDFVVDQMRPLQAQAEATLRAIATERTPSVKEIITIYLMPFATWYSTSIVARRSFRFLSRLTWQAEHDLLVKRCLPYYAPLVDRLQAALPGQPREVIALKTFIVLGTVLHSMADTRVLRGSTVPAAGVDTPIEPWKLFEHFVSFLVGGLTSG